MVCQEHSSQRDKVYKGPVLGGAQQMWGSSVMEPGARRTLHGTRLGRAGCPSRASAEVGLDSEHQKSVT